MGCCVLPQGISQTQGSNCCPVCLLHWQVGSLPMGFPSSPVGKGPICSAGDPSSIPGLGRSSGEGIVFYPVCLGFPCGSAGKESSCNVGDLGSIPGLGRSPGEGKGYPLQHSGLENSMDCNLPGSSVHGIFQARVLEWGAITSSVLRSQSHQIHREIQWWFPGAGGGEDGE